MPVKQKAVPSKYEKMIAEAKVIVEKGEAWYEKRRAELEDKYYGQYIIIHPETGEWIIAETSLEALMLAENDPKFQCLTFMRRIGIEERSTAPFWRL